MDIDDVPSRHPRRVFGAMATWLAHDKPTVTKRLIQKLMFWHGAITKDTDDNVEFQTRLEEWLGERLGCELVVEIASRYPECDKLAAVSERSQAIGEFLEWLESSAVGPDKRPVFLAYYPLITHSNDGTTLKKRDQYVSVRPACLNASIERLLAQFFEIDMDKVERERRKILEDLRSQHAAREEAAAK